MAETKETDSIGRPGQRILKFVVPKRARRLRTRLIAAHQRRKFRNLSARETFERVYTEGWWGQNGDFDSGQGSADALTDMYVALVRGFIEERQVRSVVDLGCGDFRVGRRLVSLGVRYVGIDIVDSLIERNRAEFGSPIVQFERRDLIVDTLPEGELALLRQVLQHLSNDEITAVLHNTRQYRYLIVTEHIPTGEDVVPNIDKPHGPDIRMPERSGVFLESPPFSCQGTTLLEVPYAPGQVLRTTLLENAS